MSTETTDPDRESLSALIDGEWTGLDALAEVRAACQQPELRDRWARYHLIRDVIQNSADDAFDLGARVRASLVNEPTYSNVTSLHEPPAARADAAARDRAGIGAGETAAERSTDAPAAPESDAVMPADRSKTDSRLDPGAGVVGPAVQASSGDSRSAADLEPAPGNPAVQRDSATSGSAAQSRSNGRLVLLGGALAASLAVASFVGVSVWQGGAPEGPADGSVAAVDPVLVGTPGLPSEAVQTVGFRAGESYWQTPGQGADGARNPAVEQRLNAFLAEHIEQSPVAEREGMLPYSRLVGYDSAAAR